GFVAGEKIYVGGTAFNNGTYTLYGVDANTLTLVLSDDVADESVSASLEHSILLDPGDKTDRAVTGVVHSLIKVSDLPMTADQSVGNMDGKTFYVRDVVGTSFG